MYLYTRTPINAKHSCIDQIFVKNNNQINNFQAGVIQTTISDHYSIALSTTTRSNKPTNQYKIETINYNEVENNLKTESWKELYNIKDVNKFSITK